MSTSLHVYKNNHWCSGLLVLSEDRMEEAKRRAQKIIQFMGISARRGLQVVRLNTYYLLNTISAN